MAPVSEPNKARFPYFRNVVFAAGLFLACASLAWVYLNQSGVKMWPDADSDGSILKPGLAWATGHGFYNFDTVSPAVQDFLNQNTERLAGSALDGINDFSRLRGKFHNDRRYLIFSVGLAWRLLGISWQSVRILMSIMFGIVGLLIYGIFRLGVSWRFSVAFLAPSLFSPIMLEQVYRLRSFCKAPFILAGMLIIGYLVSRKMAARTLIFVSVALGLIIGIGIGFRQDPIICLPFAFVAILFGVRGPISPGVRLLAAGLLIASFLAPAWQYLRMTRETGGNNSFYLTQGFAQRSYNDLRLSPASFTPVFSEDDFVVHGLITHYSGAHYKDMMLPVRLVFFVMTHAIVASHWRFLTPNVVNHSGLFVSPLDIWCWKAEMITRRIVTWLYTTLPGDVVARGYAAPLRILRNLQSANQGMDSASALIRVSTSFCAPFAGFLNYFGPICTMISLLVLSAVNLRLAVWTFLILLYFCGYPSLEFQIRHAFHLNFIGFWAPAFLLSIFLPDAGRFDLAGALQRLKSGRGRVIAFVSGSALVLGGTYYGARAIQYYGINPYIHKYYSASLEPVPYEETLQGSSHFCRVHLPDEKPAETQDLLNWAIWPIIEPANILSQYLVAEIEVAAGTSDLQFQYRNPDEAFDLHEHTLYGLGQRGTFRVFFPVLEYPSYFRQRNSTVKFGTFEGIQHSDNLRVKALYRVRNKQDFPFLMSVALPSNPNDVRWYHGIDLFKVLWGN